jgi:hypothetical protein
MDSTQHMQRYTCQDKAKRDRKKFKDLGYMDNTLINIRFKHWHFQLERGKIVPRITRNDYHIKNKTKTFAVYNFFGLTTEE